MAGRQMQRITPACGISLLFLLTTANSQTFTVTRSNAAYHPSHKFAPASLMAEENFKGTASGQYIVVEGYIDCLGSRWPQDDGDYHFELQSTNAKRGAGVTPNGLVCEIDPTLRLANSDDLKAIDRDKPTTYRKVRVYGYLRFGSEKTSHSGIHVYSLGNGQTIKGHWEIHPVEKVVSIGFGGPSLHIGPAATYVKPPASGRYSLTDENFKSQNMSNYAALRGTVKSITGPNNSGDYDVKLEVNTTKYTATIPQYYVHGFNSATQTLAFVHSPNFATIGYSLKPTDSKQRTFYGLRNWTFDTGHPVPALQPVEMIK
jgi:hypothetical protein